MALPEPSPPPKQVQLHRPQPAPQRSPAQQHGERAFDLALSSCSLPRLTRKPPPSPQPCVCRHTCDTCAGPLQVMRRLRALASSTANPPPRVALAADPEEAVSVMRMLRSYLISDETRVRCAALRALRHLCVEPPSNGRSAAPSVSRGSSGQQSDPRRLKLGSDTAAGAASGGGGGAMADAVEHHASVASLWALACAEYIDLFVVACVDRRSCSNLALARNSHLQPQSSASASSRHPHPTLTLTFQTKATPPQLEL